MDSPQASQQSHGLAPDQARIIAQFQRDRYAVLSGISVVEVAPGRALTKMMAGPEHLNSVGLLHGGAIFTLADVAFAAASNAHGRVAVAINVSINYVKVGSPGPVYALAVETSCSDKLATYDVRVTDESGQVLALFQGLAYRKKELLDFAQPPTPSAGRPQR